MTGLTPTRRAILFGGLCLSLAPRLARSQESGAARHRALDAIDASFDDAPGSAAARLAILAAIGGDALSPDAQWCRTAFEAAVRREASFAGRFPFGRIEASKATPYRLHSFASVDHLPAAAIDRDTMLAQSDQRLGILLPQAIRTARFALVDRALAATTATDIRDALIRQRDMLAMQPVRPSLSAGADYYQAALALKLGEAADPLEIERKAVVMAQALQSRADALLRAMGLRRGSVGERLRMLARDPAHRLPDSDEGRDRAVAMMNAALDKALARRAEWFATLPASAGAMRVRRMSRQDEARKRPGYRLLAGTDAPSYFIDLADIGARPGWTLPGIVAHELCPGHIAQGLIEAPRDPSPLWLRYGGAFSEGWAIYAERLAEEAGLFADDPLAQLGQLHGLLFRTGRALIDFGIHRHGWSAARAMRTLRDMQGFPVPYASFADDILRCATWPGAFAGEWFGHVRIAEIRESVRAREGADFNLPRFHDRLLAQGSLPIGALPALFDR